MKLEKRDFPFGLATTLAGLALGCSSVAASAATGVDEDCPETSAEIVAEFSPPSLHLDPVENVSDSAVADQHSATARPLAGGREGQTSAMLREALPQPVDEADAIGADGERSRDLPATEMRLPGIADEDLPRFRRQMFRTDI